GILSYSSGPLAWAEIVNLVFVWLVLRLVGLEGKNQDLSHGILVFAATVIVKTIAISLTVPVLYDYGVALIEAVTAAFLAIWLQRALLSVAQNGPLERFSLDERVSLGVLLLTCLSGLRGLEMQGVSLLGVFSRVVILVAVSTGGMGVGAVSGIIVGLVPGLAGGKPLSN
ncbi:MAG TPA: hypothetical protein VHS59_09280, partial [Bacillota bacterium]|nr:hypothetical protein [Bacillota bacterium]